MKLEVLNGYVMYVVWCVHYTEVQSYAKCVGECKWVQVWFVVLRVHLVVS